MRSTASSGWITLSLQRALYPTSSSTGAAHKHEFKPYETSKGTIRFHPDNRLPAALVRKLVRARIAEKGD
jgi:uncharacterized protein YdhG (YjbR/CyaY superfamily)